VELPPTASTLRGQSVSVPELVKAPEVVNDSPPRSRKLPWLVGRASTLMNDEFGPFSVTLAWVPIEERGDYPREPARRKPHNRSSHHDRPPARENGEGGAS
jgi:hypothetical protein